MSRRSTHFFTVIGIVCFRMIFLRTCFRIGAVDRSLRVVVAVVMVLQRLEGLSDYEAAERFSFDARWRFAAGVGGYGEERLQGFDRSVLVQMRERLRCSSDPDRIFRIVLEAGKEAGLVGHKRVLDSTALYDSVATMDTITLIRSAIRGVLKVLSTELEQRVRKAFVSDDSYDSSAKPSIDWEDSAGPRRTDQLSGSRRLCVSGMPGRRATLRRAAPGCGTPGHDPGSGP